MNYSVILPRTGRLGGLFLSLIVLVILVFPFSNLMELLFPGRIFGKSAWVVIPVLIIFTLYSYLLASGREKFSSADLLFFVMVILSWVIYSIRDSVYNENRSFLDYRYIATSLLFLGIMLHLMRDQFASYVVALAIVAQGVLVGLARSVNYYLFPFYMISLEDADSGVAFINSEGELTRDLLMGSSISANHIVCGMFVLLALQSNKLVRIGTVLFICVEFLMMWSTFNSLSRFPMSVAMLVFFLSLRQAGLTRLRNILTVGSVCAVILLLTIALSDTEYFNYFERFSEEAGGRYDKLVLTFQLVFTSFQDFVIGSSTYLVGTSYLNDQTISDNSYGLVATSFGTPFAIVYFLVLINALRKIRSDYLSGVFLLYIIVGLGLTNAILWESWVLAAFFGFFVTCTCVWSATGPSHSDNMSK